MIANIIQPRLQEILGMVKNKIETSGYQGMLPGGIVLTGGTALMEGIVELAANELKMPVRVGYPEAVGGLADVIHSPVFATGIGLLFYGAKRQNSLVHNDEAFFWKGLINRAKKLFRDLFEK